MRKSFVFVSVFAKMSLFAFFMCVIFASCKNNPKSETDSTVPSVDNYKWMGLEEFEGILENKENKINNYLLVDVRYDSDKSKEPSKHFEYQQKHTFCAVSIPFDQDLYDAEATKADVLQNKQIFDSTLIDGMKNRNIILQCRTDNRSRTVAKILKARGFNNLFVVYGVKGYEVTVPNESRAFNKENLTRIPAILTSQIDGIADVKVIDVRSKEDFEKGHHSKAENCLDPSSYDISKDDHVVVMAANARDAFEAAKKLQATLKKKGLDIGVETAINKKELVTQIYICVEPAK